MIRDHTIAITFFACLSLIYTDFLSTCFLLNEDNVLILDAGTRPWSEAITHPQVGQTPALRSIPALSWCALYRIFGVSITKWYGANTLLLFVASVSCYFLSLRYLSTGYSILIGVNLLLLAPFHTSMNMIAEQALFAACFGFASLATKRQLISLPFLVLSIFSKELGFAFLLAHFVLYKQWKAYLVIVSTYGALYCFALGPSVGSYSETMGFFFSTRTISYSELSCFQLFLQCSYNSLVSFISCFLPACVGAKGTLGKNWTGSRVLVDNIFWSLLFCFSFKNKRAFVFCLVLIIGSSLACAPLYRARNTLPGAVGMFLGACVGVQYLSKFRFGFFFLYPILGYLVARRAFAVLVYFTSLAHESLTPKINLLDIPPRILHELIQLQQ